MNSAFDNHKTIGLRRLLCIIAVILLLTSTLAACGKKNEEETEPSTNNSMLDLEDETDPIETTTEEPTEDPNAGPSEEILAIRAAPTLDSNVITYLEPGATVDILREEEVGDLTWGLIREGWICIELIQEYTGPGAIIIGGVGSNSQESTPTQPATEPTTGNNNNGNGGTGNNNNGGTNNNNNNNNGTKKAGIVTASELNIRDSADISGKQLGMYHRGDRVYILETKNGWGRTDKGWVSMDYIYEDGTTGKSPAKGVVTGEGLNIRSGPGTNFDSVGSHSYGDRVNILERIQIGDSWWGCTSKGWISLSYVYIDGTEGEGAGFGTVSGDGVNVRSGPGTGHDAIGSLNSGTNVDVLFQIKLGDMTWGCIKYGNGYGWISMSYVGMG